MKLKQLLFCSILLFSFQAIFSQNYAKFMGIYTLKTSKNDTSIKYDYITMDYKDGKFICKRIYCFTTKASFEQIHNYEIVNLDTDKKTITIKMDNNKATYTFRKNSNGTYDLVVFDNILIYAKK